MDVTTTLNHGSLMLVKCICTNCSGHLEFEEENAGTIIKCPHCGWDTRLYDAATSEDSETDAEPGTGPERRRRRLMAFLGAGVLLVAAAAFSVNKWVFPRVEEYFPNAEGKVIQSLIVVVALFGMAVVLIWAAFPVLLLLQLKKMNRLLQSISFQSRPALPVQHLQEDDDDQEEQATEQENADGGEQENEKEPTEGPEVKS